MYYIFSVTTTLNEGGHGHQKTRLHGSRPRCEGRIIYKKKGNATYVLYQYAQDYRPEKKYAVPKRALVGKLSTADPSRMLPNDRFQKFFPDEALPEERGDAYRSCSLRIGAHVAIAKVVREYGIDALQRHAFGADAGLVLDLLSYLVVEEENAGQYYPDYAFGHPLFSEGMRIASDSKVCRFLKSVTRDRTAAFQEAWNAKRPKDGRIYISYDSSNKNCQAGDIDLVEFGHAKDERRLPVFNVAVAYDKTNRVQLFYEEYPGSVTDVSQFVYMVDKVVEYGYKSVGFVLDRGYFSKKNIGYMETNGLAFIIMAKGCKRLVSSLVESVRGTFETDRDCSIRSYRVYGKTVRAKLYEDDARERFFHIYFGVSRQSAEREQLERTLDRMRLSLDRALGAVATFGKEYADRFELAYDRKGTLVSYAERKDLVRRELDLCGYFVIVTSEEMTATQTLVHYKGRDVSEKLFCADKSFLGSRSMRVQTEESLRAKLFVEFVALIVRNRMYNLLKDTMLRMETRPNFMTVLAAIRELEKMEMVRRSGGLYRLDHAVTKQRQEHGRTHDLPLRIKPSKKPEGLPGINRREAFSVTDVKS